MKKGPLLIVLGIVLLLAGIVLEWHSGPPKAAGSLVQACRNEITRRGGEADMIAHCDDTAFATMTTATDAETAARSISAANNQEVGTNTLAMFLIGLGAALTVGGVVVHRRTSASGA